MKFLKVVTFKKVTTFFCELSKLQVDLVNRHRFITLNYKKDRSQLICDPTFFDRIWFFSLYG